MMSYDVTDEEIKVLLGAGRHRPIARLKDNGDEWVLDTFSLSKRQPVYSDGWGHDLRPTSRFYKRWFDFPELGKKGWAIIFRIFDPVGEPTQDYETYPGWVPAEREAEADAWIATLNGEIRARLAAR